MRERMLPVVGLVAAALVVALLAGTLIIQAHHNSSPGTEIVQKPTPGPTATATPTPSPTPVPVATPVMAPWHVVASPDTSAEGGVLKAIAAASPSDLWAVGTTNTQNGTTPLIEHGNGSAWTVVASPTAADGTLNALNAVAAISSSDVWAVGMSGTHTLAEHWNGGQWVRVASPNQGNLENALLGITAISSNNVWAVGYYVTGPGCGGVLTQPQPLIEHWDGAQWSIVPSPHVTSTSPLVELSAISAASASDIWAVGTVSGDGLIEHYNGASWSLIPAPSGAILNGVIGLSAGNAWAVGWTQSGPLTANWNGSQWTTVATPQTGGAQSMLAGISGTGPNDLWAVGGDFAGGCSGSSLPLIEHWNGQAWTVVTSADLAGVQSGYLDAVVAISSNDVWAVGQVQNQNPSGGEYSLIVHYTG